MSNEAMNWAWEQEVEPVSVKFVLVALSNFADAAGRCFPGRATLAAMTSQSEKNVSRALKRLAAVALIRRERERQERSSGRFDIDVYYLNAPPERLRIHRKGAAPASPAAPAPGDKDVPRTAGQGCPTDRGTRMSHGPRDKIDTHRGTTVGQNRHRYKDEPIEPNLNQRAREADGGSGPSASARLEPVVATDVGDAEAAAWRLALAGLARQMAGDEWRAWLGQLVLVAATAEAFTAAAPTGFMRDWIANSYGQRLRAACGRRRVELVVAAKGKAGAQA